MLIAHERLAHPSLAWASRVRALEPQQPPAQIAAELRNAAIGFARTNGAVAGTPFLTALVPAYMSVLWEQARMTMKIAALNDRDPRDPRCAAEVLYLRGIYHTPDAAARALSRLDTTPTRSGARPGAKLRSWIQLIYVILILAGFLFAPDDRTTASRPAWLISNMFAARWFVITWVIPVTCMIEMAHVCASDTRTLANRAIEYYAGASTSGDQAAARASARAHQRTVGHRLLLIISLAIPLGLITLAVLDPIHHSHLVAISAFLGLGVVFALWATAARAWNTTPRLVRQRAAPNG